MTASISARNFARRVTFTFSAQSVDPSVACFIVLVPLSEQRHHCAATLTSRVSQSFPSGGDAPGSAGGWLLAFNGPKEMHVSVDEEVVRATSKKASLAGVSPEVSSVGHPTSLNRNEQGA